jgi:hypothetical protein
MRVGFGEDGRPGAFNLLSPVDHAAGVPTSGVLSWDSAFDIESYDVYLFVWGQAELLVSAAQIPAEFAYSGLTPGGVRYQWYVLARNAFGLTQCRVHFDFTTV